MRKPDGKGLELARRYKMPGGDGTGPMGKGPMTGRGAGYCAGYESPGFTDTMPRRGFRRGPGFGRRAGAGRGFGRGFGWRWMPSYGYPVEPSREDEKTELERDMKDIEEEKRSLEQEKERIQKRLEELGKEQQ